MKKFTSSGIEYELIEFLGEGGSSEVYRAKRRLAEVNVDQELALKILKSETLVDIWRKEFQEFQGLQSRHLVSIFGFDKVDGRPALLMEYVEGISLSELKRYKNIEPSLKQEILSQIQIGLRDLHVLGKCHGDLSPNNILIDTSGRVVLTDFLGQQAGFGTLDFSSPIILAGGQPSQETDEYSFDKIATWLAIKTQHGSPDIKKQSLLAQVIKEIRQLKEKRSASTQALVGITPQKKWRLVPLILTLFFMPFLAGSEAMSIQRSDYRIEIITENWADITINGKPMGFPPIFYISSTPNVLIQWKNRQSSGQLQLNLRPGEYRRIHDEQLILSREGKL